MNSTTAPTETSSETTTRPSAPGAADPWVLADSALRCAASIRHGQLRDLPDADNDPVVAAQRTALLQTLTDIAAARERVAAGTYGSCTGCGDPIPPGRLEFRPWAATCVACLGR